jgi:glutathione synthase/RimK-type ligase-like ATP-grasp enzyme
MVAELDAFQLDPIPRCRTASLKLYQHRVASEVGLAIPRTVVTNDRAEVRRLAREVSGGRLVTKMNYGFARERPGDGWYEKATTTPVTDADLEALEGLDLCPMIFQEEVPKKLELRVTIVGTRLFAAEVDSQSVPANRHDWRVDQGANRWRPCQLPAPVADKLVALLTRLGLNYGACDMILTPDEQYVFLEVNTNGMFTWIEDQTGLPISEAIADLLAGRAVRRV